MDFHQLLYIVIVLVLIALIGFGVQWLTAWKATAAASKYPLLSHLADVGVRIGNDALALLRANPALTPAAVLAWGVKELKATAPDTVKQLGEDASDVALNNLVRRSIITTAQAGTLDDAANKVITDLAPSVVTAKVTPPVASDVTTTVAGTLPTLEEIVETVLSRIKPPAVTVTPAAPVVQPAIGPVASPVATSVS